MLVLCCLLACLSACMNQWYWVTNCLSLSCMFSSWNPALIWVHLLVTCLLTQVLRQAVVNLQSSDNSKERNAKQGLQYQHIHPTSKSVNKSGCTNKVFPHFLHRRNLWSRLFPPYHSSANLGECNCVQDRHWVIWAWVCCNRCVDHLWEEEGLLGTYSCIQPAWLSHLSEHIAQQSYIHVAETKVLSCLFALLVTRISTTISSQDQDRASEWWWTASSQDWASHGSGAFRAREQRFGEISSCRCCETNLGQPPIPACPLPVMNRRDFAGASGALLSALGNVQVGPRLYHCQHCLHASFLTQ